MSPGPSHNNNNPIKPLPAQPAAGLSLPPKRKATPTGGGVQQHPGVPPQQQQQHAAAPLYPNILPAASNMFATNTTNGGAGTGVPQNPLLPAGLLLGGNAAAATTNGSAAGGAFANPTSLLPQQQHIHPMMNGMQMNHPSMTAASLQAAAASAANSNNNNAGTATFFRGWRLRSGKWLEEEETYAELLIDMFDRGLLPDCVTGSTLRAYLAQKLHCAPMRISKKFAGKGIGKKVYTCQMDSGTGNRKHASAQVVEKRKKLQEKVKTVEKAFHEAASSDAQPELQPPTSLLTNFIPMIPTPPGMQFAVPAMVAAAHHFFPRIAQNGFLAAMNHQPTANNNLFAKPQQQQQQGLTSSVPNATATANSTPGAAAPTAPAMTQLQESYMKALSSQPNDTKNAVVATGQLAGNKMNGNHQVNAQSNTGSPNQRNTALLHHSASAPAGTLTNMVSTSAANSMPTNPQNTVFPNVGPGNTTETGISNSATGTLAQAALIYSSRAPTTTSAPVHGIVTAQAANVTMQQVSAQATAPSQATKTGNHTGNATGNMGAIEHPHFPDFMAGFDKVALSMKPANSSSNSPFIDEPTALQCSPPFTSQSFDDFHRLLGKDLTPLDDGTAEAALTESPVPAVRPEPGSTTDANKSPDKVSLDTTALFTAESYAMFAQESALAASQHAAYIAESNDPVPGRNQRIGSFDFDGTMKLVSQHVPIAPRGGTIAVRSMRPENKPKAPALGSIFSLHRNPRDKGQLEKSLTMSASTTQPPSSRKSTPVVSGSEPTSSATESSVKGSTSESNGSDNTLSNSDDGHCESGDDTHSSDDHSYDDMGDLSPKRKKSDGDTFASLHILGSGSDEYGSTGRHRNHKKRKPSMGSS